MNGEAGMKKRAEQTLLTREKLINAFWTLYEQKHFDQITVREISDLAGYNRSTFYTYFKDVYDVLEQAENEIYRMFEEEFDHSRHMDNKEQMIESVRFIGRFLERNQKRLMLLLGENGDVKFTHRIMQRMREHMRLHLRAFTKGDDAEFEYMVEYIINAHVGLMLRWFQSGCDIPFEQMTALILRLTTGGLVSALTGSDAALEQAAALFKVGGAHCQPGIPDLPDK